MQLKEGEMICRQCKGHGEIIKKIDDIDRILKTCNKCFGTGKLDWIENIVGKDPYNFLDDPDIQAHMKKLCIDSFKELSEVQPMPDNIFTTRVKDEK